jgi:hypothetical protein
MIVMYDMFILLFYKSLIRDTRDTFSSLAQSLYVTVSSIHSFEFAILAIYRYPHGYNFI